MDIFGSKVNIWNVSWTRVTAFIFDSANGCSCESVEVLDTENVSTRGVITSIINVGWQYLYIPKIQRCSFWSLGLDELFHPTFYWANDYLSMLGLKLVHVSKSDPRATCPIEILSLNISFDNQRWLWQLIYLWKIDNAESRFTNVSGLIIEILWTCFALFSYD